MSSKKSVLKKKNIILVLLIVLVGSIFLIHKLSVANQLKTQKLYDKEILSKFNQEKKGYELYLEQLNLKSDKLNIIHKLRGTHSEKDLLLLIKSAKVKSEDNIKSDEKSKEQAINKNNDSSKEASAFSSIKNQKQPITPESSSIQTFSEEQDNDQISESSQAKSSLTAQTSVQRTDGLNFNGEHYDIKEFSGLGHVPVDKYIYQWLDYTEHLHLLAERQSPVGRDVRELSIGSKIIVNNRTYTIYNVINGITNDEHAYNSLSNGKPALTIQSCDSDDENSTLTIWYAS